MENTAYIALLGSIESRTAEELLEIISSKLPTKTDTLYILFSTGGGNVTAGFAIYNILKALPYKIIMHNIGSVDSIGVSIFLAADERYSTANGTFLIHRVRSTQKQKDVDEGFLKEKISCVEVEEEKISKVILAGTKIEKPELAALFEAGELKTAEYALQKGLIQQIRPIPTLAPQSIFTVKCQ